MAGKRSIPKNRALHRGSIGIEAMLRGGAMSRYWREKTMTTATIDGLEVSYEMRGSGPALLMLAPGGFDATMEKWTTAGVWKGMRPLDTLASDFTLIAYDSRESGHSGGRVEKLSWALFADQAPQAEFWPVMPPEQTPDRVRERILEFGRAHRG
jgi:hypothetical protein